MGSTKHDKTDDALRAVEAYWEAGSCGEELFLKGTELEDYERQASERYGLEPNIPRFAEFERYRGQRVLEIGVGIGADHRRFAEAGADLVGIDLTDRAVQHVRRQFELTGLASDLRIGSAETLDFASDSFDLVYAWGVLHHTPDTPSAVREVLRVLRPGGEAKVMIYHKQSMVGYMLWLRYALARGKPHMSLAAIYAQHLESPGTKAYTVDEARSLFEGFEIIDAHSELTHADLLSSTVGQRHRGAVLDVAQRLWPRWLIKRFFARHGLFLLMHARKPMGRVGPSSGAGKQAVASADLRHSASPMNRPPATRAEVLANPRLRVLYVHHRREGGGAPTSLALLIEGLGDRVDAIVLCPGGAAADQFRGVGATVIEAPVIGFSHSWTGTYRSTRAALLAADAARLPPHLHRLGRMLRDFRPDVVHLNEMSLLPAAALARRRGVPVVWHLRAALPLDDLPDTRLVRWAVANLATVAIAINHDVAATYRAPPNMHVVFNPVRIPPPGQLHGAAAKQALGLRPDAIVVGMLSKLYGLKGWRDLLEATAAARRGGTDLQLALVGGAVRPSAWFATRRGRLLGRLARLEDTERELTDAVIGLELTDAVHLVSFRKDVSAIYAALDVVCAPSRGPELGRPVLEGQAHGLPVIATGSSRGGGVVEHNVDGLIVQADDHRALTSALTALARDPGLRHRLGERARRTAERHYAHDTVADKILEMYRSVTM